MYHVPVDSNDDGVSAIVIRGRKEKLAAPTEAYFETLHAGVRAWFEYYLAVAEQKGLKPYAADNFPFTDTDYYEQWEPMSYETSQQHDCHLYVKKTGKLKTRLRISVYRMPSGRYEVTAYIA